MNTTTKVATRWYVRCRDCVEPFVIAADSVPPALLCACGGKTETMGEVSGRRWAKVELLCACDARCQGATGPSCDCQCRGENHGSTRLVEVVKDGGAMRLASCPPNCIERSAEYRAALDAARARIVAKYGDVPAMKARGEWVNGDAYWGHDGAVSLLVHAKKLRTHKGRVAALAKVCA